MAAPLRMTRRALLRAGMAGVAGSAVTMAYADRSAHSIALERHTLRLPKWDADGFRIVVISDVHVNTETAMRRARAASELALAEGPDLVVVVGDFVNTSRTFALEFIRQSFEPLGGLACPCVAVMGNHDYWTEQPRRVVDAVVAGPMRLLRNERFETQGVMVAGVDDAIAGRHRLEFIDEGSWSGSVVSLLHEPDFVRLMPVRVGLQISGHSHGGQMCLPFGIPIHTPPGARDYVAGFYPQAPVPLYVTRGVGTVGPDLRTFCAPEVSVLTLMGVA